MVKQKLKKTAHSIFGGKFLSLWFVLFSTSLCFVALLANWGYIFQRALIMLTVNCVLVYACYSWVVPVYIQRKRVKTAVIIFVLLIIAVTALRTITDRILLNKFDWKPVYHFSWQGRLLLMLFAEFSIAIFVILLRLAVASYKNRKRMSELEKLQLSTELQFLKAQMSPHFLFNSINNIYSLVLSKSDHAPEALMKLSELLRYSLYDCHDKVTIQQEIEAIESYLKLFRLKFEENIRLEFSSSIDNTNFKIEPLLFIPLLENALKYSGIGNNLQSYVLIHLWFEDNILVFNIVNSKGLVSKIQEASGIGLTNIRKRLENIYPGHYSLNIFENEERFKITLKLKMQ